MALLDSPNYDSTNGKPFYHPERIDINYQPGAAAQVKITEVIAVVPADKNIYTIKSEPNLLTFAFDSSMYKQNFQAVNMDTGAPIPGVFYSGLECMGCIASIIRYQEYLRDVMQAEFVLNNALLNQQYSQNNVDSDASNVNYAAALVAANTAVDISRKNVATATELAQSMIVQPTP